MTEAIDPRTAIAEEVLIPIRLTLICTQCSRPMAKAGQSVGQRNQVLYLYECKGCLFRVSNPQNFPSIQYRSSEDAEGGGAGAGSLG